VVGGDGERLLDEFFLIAEAAALLLLRATDSAAPELAARCAQALRWLDHDDDDARVRPRARSAGDDLAAARRCYRRLAVGALRFLDLPLVNLGWLPNPGPHFAAALAHAAQVIQSHGREPAPAEVMQ